MEEDEDEPVCRSVRWANAAEFSVRAGDVGALRMLLRGEGEGGNATGQVYPQHDPAGLHLLMERDPVHIACAAGHRDIVLFMLTEVAPWSIMGLDKEGGATVLHTAARFDRVEIARDLVEHGALINSRDRGECTPRK